MKMKNASTLLIVWLIVINVNAQNKKMDTTMKFGMAGYRVLSSNKSAEKNNVTITPIGFSSGAQKDASFDIKGIIKKAAVEDFNNDGFPDLVLLVTSNGINGNMVNVIGIASQNNESMRPIFFPDILDDPKLRIGYKGYDEYKVVQGTLFRKFPVYNLTDTLQSGSFRNIQYGVINSENGVLKFKVLRTYESK